MKIKISREWTFGFYYTRPQSLISITFSFFCFGVIYWILIGCTVSWVFKPPILIYRKGNLFYHIRGVNQFIGHCIIPDSCFWLLFHLLWLKFIFQNFWIAKFVVWVILESWYFWSLDCGQTWCWPACRGSAPMTAFRELKLLPLSSSCYLSKIFHSYKCK